VFDNGNVNDFSAIAADISEANEESTIDNQTVSEYVENTGDRVPEGMPNIEMPDVANSMNERFCSRSGHYNKWTWYERNINRWNDTVLSCYGIANDPSANGIVLTQQNIHQGLKLVGKAGENAVTTERKQLHF